MKQRTQIPFVSIEDLKQRVPQIQKDELRALASVGALNFIAGLNGKNAPPNRLVAGRKRKSSFRTPVQDAAECAERR